MEALSLAIIILFFLVAWHFVYEGLIASSFRANMRNELFTLRDRIRHLIASGTLPSEDQEGASFVHDGISSFLNRLPGLSLSVFAAAVSEIETDKATVQEIRARLSRIKGSSSTDVKQIFKSTNRIVRKALIVNSGGWLIYMIPIALIILTFSRLKKNVYRLVSAPPQDVDRLLPERA